MTTLLYAHPACLEHDPGRHHPESAARLRAVFDTLADPEFARLERREAPEATLEDLLRVHPRAHVERLLRSVPKSGHVGIDADTILSPASGAAALRAAGAVIAATDAVAAREADNAFCAVRPPGHHAEPERAMGFCLLTTSPSARCTLARRTSSTGSPSSISMFITATALRRLSRPITGSSMHRHTSPRSTPAPGRQAKLVSATSLTCRSDRWRARASFAPE